MKISGLLWEAANEYLSHNYECWIKYRYSCKAIIAASRCNAVSTESVYSFLETLGFSEDLRESFDIFNDIPQETRQGARYLWLMFAYEVALDYEKEGLI